MKKTITANIAGNLFQIEEEAYVQLENYLSRIESGYKNSSEGREIVNDIEQRMGELLEERTQSRTKIITSDDVNWLISILGKPEDLGASGTYQESKTERPNYSYSKPVRRLYRDPGNRVIGGVCGGLGAYFNTDPVLLRICFVIGLFMGFGPLVYLIMWIALPKAKTVMQKLEMHGEAPTPENMRKYS